jgi:hypothetical protein
MIFLVSISIGEVDAYSQLADALAIQQVVNQGGKFLFLSPNAERFFFVLFQYMLQLRWAIVELEVFKRA